MTYTEFIKKIENNISKVDCNKLTIVEYEEKQKQIYKQIKAEAIDEFVKMAYEELLYSDGLCEIDIDYIAEQLKAGGEE